MHEDKKDMTVEEYMSLFTERAVELVRLPLEQQPKESDTKNKQVEDMIEEYYQFTGKLPKPYMLNYLANYLLSGELKDRDADKVANHEYPVMSDYQLKRRERTQISMEQDVMNFLDSKQNKGLDSLAKTPIKKPVY